MLCAAVFQMSKLLTENKKLFKMSILRLYSNKNNTIASGVFEDMNSGQNAVTDLWYGGSGKIRNSISRFLIQFPSDEYK